jgi:hypothetical protein
MSEKKDIVDLFRQWLTEENLFKSTIQDERLIFGFNFVFPPGSPVMFSVVQQKNLPDSVIVTLGIAVSEDHLRIMRSWQPKKRKEFLCSLFTELHRLRAEFNPRVEGELLLNIGFARRMFVTDLRKEDFWDTLVFLNSLRNLFVLQIQKETDTLSFAPGGPGKPSPPDLRMYG